MDSYWFTALILMVMGSVMVPMYSLTIAANGLTVMVMALVTT